MFVFSFQGAGPVHLIGQHLLGALVEEFEDMDDMEEEMLDEEEGDEPHVSIKKNYVLNFLTT